MNRRQFLGLAGAMPAWALLTAHSPYRQWAIFRQTHLVIITTRDDPAGDELGEACAAIVRAALPDSKATVGRGPRVERIASLMSTGQAEVAITTKAHALDMFHGADRFRDYGAIPLRVLVQSDTHQMICREEFLQQHGYLLAEALVLNGASLRLSVPRDTPPGGIPPHDGAAAFAQGLPLEPPPGR
jgi:hypothetical protein